MYARYRRRAAAELPAPDAHYHLHLKSIVHARYGILREFDVTTAPITWTIFPVAILNPLRNTCLNRGGPRDDLGEFLSNAG